MRKSSHFLDCFGESYKDLGKFCKPILPNNAEFYKTKITVNMKNLILRSLLLLLVMFSVTSCELIGDIFQAGVGVGIFLVILVIAVVVWAISKFRN